jgi:hypothetical protein
MVAMLPPVSLFFLFFAGPLAKAALRCCYTKRFDQANADVAVLVEDWPATYLLLGHETFR